MKHWISFFLRNQNKIKLFAGYGVTILFLTSCNLISQWQTYRQNIQGISQIKDKNASASERAFREALATDPFLPALHLNLGVALRVQSKSLEAEKSYNNAIRFNQEESPLIRYISFYNLGELAQADRKIDEALKYYQLALKEQPESIQVKTNIELLFQQGQGQGQGDKSDDQGEGDPQKNDENKEEDPKEYQQNQRYQPREFQGDLNEADVKKILGEIRQQEQKIRQEFQKRDQKERPRAKDW